MERLIISALAAACVACSAQAPVEAAQRPANLTIRGDGVLLLDGQQVARSDLAARAQGRRVFIRAEAVNGRMPAYTEFMPVLNTLMDAGISVALIGTDEG